ncbi:hypothetical protein QN277_009276 [Acacia crassicarpa]|uniref:Uncharacterized protein n=1 Tax=Acacia crassicarpa TaxID=499986 RepID=A0AAE1M927_9FABA|nr:hypothetical protein QN277_009276 [Acacia crassicarpa]
MGIIRSSLSFITGTIFGVYLAQSYQLPNIKKLTETATFMAEEIEKKYRKPKKEE